MAMLLHRAPGRRNAVSSPSPTMSATLAPTPWPAPVAQPSSSGWRFGQAWFGADRQPGVQWVLRRNCSISPRQLGSVYASLCAFSLLIAAGFAYSGAPAVLAFAGLELALVGLAMLVYARHACDGDTLTLSGQSLSVEQAQGPHIRRTEFRAEWVSVEPSHGEGSLVELSGQGQRIRVARFVRPEMRSALAQELRVALRSARAARPASTDPLA